MFARFLRQEIIRECLYGADKTGIKYPENIKVSNQMKRSKAAVPKLNYDTKPKEVGFLFTSLHIQSSILPQMCM